MRYYQRTTRQCQWQQLRPALRAAIEKHAADNLFGDVVGQLLACIETESVQQKQRGLAGWRDRLLGPNDPDEVHYTAAVLLPNWLIWATSGEKRGTTTLSARLGDIRIEDFTGFGGIEDNGINISGTVRGSKEQTMAFLGLGEGEAADNFKRRLRQAIQQANTAKA
jgi:hypothetical protein